MSQSNHLKIVKGDASPEEIAALVVALSAATPSPAAAVPGGGSWRDRGRSLRGVSGAGRAWRAGPGAWRASGLPE
ncbi:acyl-CoA carboxylase epsilon subunit [Acrocarpospora corrugata]|uniref:acyl-CoA carboxylase epsilon subunit n=1 Tax=Acrocarpospora corrugata TaxID=35763 RepID=UPI0012D2F0E2|nr:acyl-CoA carboxylase epsilon subunit [Acrocarpospora corrugata]